MSDEKIKFIDHFYDTHIFVKKVIKVESPQCHDFYEYLNSDEFEESKEEYMLFSTKFGTPSLSEYRLGDYIFIHHCSSDCIVNITDPFTSDKVIVGSFDEYEQLILKDVYETVPLIPLFDSSEIVDQVVPLDIKVDLMPAIISPKLFSERHLDEIEDKDDFIGDCTLYAKFTQCDKSI